MQSRGLIFILAAPKSNLRPHVKTQPLLVPMTGSPAQANGESNVGIN